MSDTPDIITVPNQYYVGFVGEGQYNYDKNAKVQLGFATPFDKDDSAFRKRKDTVDSWCGQNGTNRVIPNTPRTGFKIEESVTRYSTSNKVFRVCDPEGFKLEISAECLADIIEQCTLVKGVIQEELVWARRGGQNILVTTTDEAYILSQQKEVKPSELQVNDVVILNKNQHIFLGKKYLVIIEPKDKATEIAKQTLYTNDKGHQDWTKPKYRIDYNWKHKIMADKYFCFMFYDESDYKSNRVDARKTVKIQARLKNDPNHKLPQSGKEIDLQLDNHNIAQRGNKLFMFDTLEEAKAFDVQAVINSLPKEKIREGYY